MARMKIYEIAKSLDIKSGELVKALNNNGFEAKSHNSNIEDAAIGFILKHFSPKKKVKKEEIELKKAEVDNTEAKAVELKKEEVKTIETKSIEPKKIEIKNTEEKAMEHKKIEKTKVVEKQEEKVKRVEEKETNVARKEEKAAAPEVKAAENKGQEPKRQEVRTNGTNEGRKSKNSFHKENNERNNDRNSDRNNNDRRNHNNDRRNQNGGGNRENRDNREGRDNNRDNNRGGNFNRDNNRSGRDNNRGGQKPFNNEKRDNNNDRRNQNGNGGFGNRDNRDNNKDRDFDRDNRGSRDNNRGGGRFGGGSSKPNFEKPLTFETPTMEKTSKRKNDYNNKNSHNDKNRNNKKFKDEMPKKDPNRKGAFIMPKPVIKEEVIDDGIKTIVIPEVLTIRDLAEQMKQPAANVVKKLFLQGKMFSINQEITFEEAEEIALEFNCIAEMEEKVDVIEELLKEAEEDESTLENRPPVICVMGHVDHGKTSLLDAIRKTNVTEKEAGGITQHIGAYTVTVNNEKITFLDTPGHEAFTSMRMRGAKSTDIAILVVAADDGVMPQTVEAISHARAAEVDIIVAINKIDKPGANIDRVKQELSEQGLISEDWGGDTVFVPVSAKTGEGIENLLEMVLITAEMAELKANPNRKARGIVIEAQLDKGRGPVATILVQKGTLHVGDAIAIGSAHGKVRAMIDDKGRRVKTATPSTPVEILGLNEVPDAGEIFMVTENEKEARNIAEAYIKQKKERLLADTKSKLSLDGLFSQIQAGNIKELNLIIKADVQGSVEAVKQSLLKLSNEEVAIRVIHGGVGAINESDVTLASASNAIIIGFNVRPDPAAKETSEREKIDLRLYKVIYNAIEDIEAAMKGMLDPIFEEKIIGHAEVRQTFKASGVGMIAGSYVLNGKIIRGSKARIFRGEEMIYEGVLSSLKRFKDDVKEVKEGYECGLVFEKFNDIKEEDRVEVYVMEEVPR